MLDLQEINWLVFALVCLCLFLAGIGAAWLAVRMGRSGATKGRLALLTMVCVFVVLVGAIFIIGFIPAVLVGLLFIPIAIPVFVAEALEANEDDQKALAARLEGIPDAES